MRNITTFALTLTLTLAFALWGVSSASAQTCPGGGKNFVDLDGDGFNDNAPDVDGDGIPNGLDTDYVKQARDGDGNQLGQAGQKQQRSAGEGVDAKFKRVRGATASQLGGGVFGSGQGGFGSGVCDGTGPHGGGGGVCDGSGPKGRGGHGH